MPRIRILGNAALSFMTKFSTGYWSIFVPTNGYTVIHSNVIRLLPLDKISTRYFFETDMLFRLSTLRAVVYDVPMRPNYGDEKSNLVISQVVSEFYIKHHVNFFKRIFYNYYLRDMSVASIELPLGLLSLVFGVGYGIAAWVDSVRIGIEASAGTVMLAALPVIMGLQLVLSFLSFDMNSEPDKVIHR